VGFSSLSGPLGTPLLGLMVPRTWRRVWSREGGLSVASPSPPSVLAGSEDILGVVINASSPLLWAGGPVWILDISKMSEIGEG